MPPFHAGLFDTGHNRKTDAHDAHAVAVVAVRTRGLRVLSYDSELDLAAREPTAAEWAAMHGDRPQRPTCEPAGEDPIIHGP
jgi:hypothetical protein